MKKMKNERMINIDEKSTENVKMKRIVKKKFSKKKFWYNNIRNRRREELECRNSYKILYGWYDDNLEQLYKILFRISKFFKKRERGANA